jgi:hypothetical protein
MAERVVDLKLPIRIGFKKFHVAVGWKVGSTGQVKVPGSTLESN